jgi:hypothetical protein
VSSTVSLIYKYKQDNLGELRIAISRTSLTHVISTEKNRTIMNNNCTI